MKRNVYLRVLTLLLGVICLLGAVMLPVGATPPLEEEPNANQNAVKWTFSEDYQRLVGDGAPYDRYVLPVGYEVSYASRVYSYDNRPEVGNYAYAGYVYSNERRGDLHWVDYSPLEGSVYVTEAGRAHMDAFIGGEVGQYRLSQLRSTYATMDAAEVEALAAYAEGQGQTVTLDVAELREMEMYEIFAYDGYDVIRRVEGALYVHPAHEGYLYIHYSTLDNSYFDADGNFSYRQGTVEAVELSEEYTLAVNDRISVLNYLQIEYTREYDELNPEEPATSSEDSAVTFFWIFFVFVGFLLPIAPLVVGLVFANSRRMSHPKRWYIVVALAAAWLLLSLMLAVGLIV